MHGSGDWQTASDENKDYIYTAGDWLLYDDEDYGYKTKQNQPHAKLPDKDLPFAFDKTTTKPAPTTEARLVHAYLTGL